MEATKIITAGLMVNENEVQVRITLDAAEAERLVELFKQAEGTVLGEISADERPIVFDAWLKAQDSALYDKALAAFHKAFSVKLGETYADDPAYYDSLYKVHVPRSIDDSYCLEEGNDIKFDYFE